MNINSIDLILVSIILLSIVYGFYRGFILGFLDLTRWVASIVAAFLFYNPISHILGDFMEWSRTWSHPAAFVLIVIVSSIIFQILGNLLVRQLPEDTHKNFLNRAFGMVPGFISGFVIAAILAALLFAMPFSNGYQETLEESSLVEPLAVYSDELEIILTPIFEDAVNETLTRRLTVYPGSDETVELPFTVTDFETRPDLEAQMLVLINEERAKEGLPRLEPDPEMREVARGHSADMFKRGYFAHKTPEDKSPFDRMDEARVKFKTAGENLALAPTLKIAHTGLMNSPGHRANILQPNFGRVGIGILDGGRRGLMVTQNFRN